MDSFILMMKYLFCCFFLHYIKCQCAFFLTNQFLRVSGFLFLDALRILNFRALKFCFTSIYLAKITFYNFQKIFSKHFSQTTFNEERSQEETRGLVGFVHIKT